MNTNTRATSTIFVLLVVTTTSLLFVASGTMTGLAASSDPYHGSGKTSDQSRTNNSVSESGNHMINSPSFTTTNENPNLDTLLACESGAANGSGHLTMSEVMNCYLQFSRGSASSMAVLGDQNSDRTGGGAGLGLTSDHYDSSKTTTHSSSHHKNAADSISPSHNPTTTD